jgi:hypothetical protein
MPPKKGTTKMSIVTNKHGDFPEALNGRVTCSFCGKRELGPPYLEWVADTTIRICNMCCHLYRDKFMAELDHIAALANLQWQSLGRPKDADGSPATNGG